MKKITAKLSLIAIALCCVVGALRSIGQTLAEQPKKLLQPPVKLTGADAQIVIAQISAITNSAGQRILSDDQVKHIYLNVVGKDATGRTTLQRISVE